MSGSAATKILRDIEIILSSGWQTSREPSQSLVENTGSTGPFQSLRGRCQKWVIRVVLAADPSLPVYHHV
jgi:hypothetical protein